MARLITQPTAAMRLARTIASDILLYNREKVSEGIKNDDLFDRLAEEIEEGHRHFNERTDEALRDTHNYLDRALVDVLVQRSADDPTDCW